jgi:hypothetical protein
VTDPAEACRGRTTALAAALERRARACPGLLPVETAQEFLSLAARAEGLRLPVFSSAELRSLWLRLEAYHRHPLRAVQDAREALRTATRTTPRPAFDNAVLEYSLLRDRLLRSLSPVPNTTGVLPCPS